MPDLGVGIDFGGCNCCVGVVVGADVQIICNELGRRLTPSCLSFVGGEVFVGDDAKQMASIRPGSAIFDVKSLIGRPLESLIVQNTSQRWSCELQADEDGAIIIPVRIGTEEILYTPMEISAILLEELKLSAESAFVDRRATSAVIGVPSFFSEDQREIIREAALKAGFTEGTRITPACSLVAIAYSHARNIEASKPETIVIFDLGADKLDTAIVTIDEDIIRVKASAGTPFLGGARFTDILVEDCLREFQSSYDVDLTGHPRSLLALRLACEKAKRKLTDRESYTVEIEHLYQDIDFEFRIHRNQFHLLSLPLYPKCFAVLNRLFSESNFQISQIDKVVLVGGASRMPTVRGALTEYFPNTLIDSQTLDPDTAVAQGAAIHAALPMRRISNSFQDKILVDETRPLA